MKKEVKLAIYWLLLGVGFLTHTVLHLYGLFYGVDVRLEEATGEVPIGVGAFNTFLFTGTLLMALLSIHVVKKGFRWFSLVWSSLFFVLNVFHLGATAVVEAFDISQVSLLTLVVGVNVLLIVELWKSVGRGVKKCVDE